MEASVSTSATPSQVARLFPGLAMVFGAGQTNARLSVSTLGRGRVIRIANLAARVQRDARQDETSHFVKLLLQVRGESLVLQDGRRSSLSPGDLSLLDGSRPFVIECGHHYEHLLFQLPRVLVTQRHPKLIGISGGALRRGDPAHAMVFDSLTAMNRHLPAVADEQRAATLTAIVGLLGALEPTSDEAPGSRGRLARALADIDAHLADPDLSAAMLAAFQGISRRRMDAVFAAHGMSLGRLIWDRRLESVAAALRTANQRGRLVDLAFAAGFSSEAHFSRAFRRKFGETASAYRRRLAS